MSQNSCVVYRIVATSLISSLSLTCSIPLIVTLSIFSSSNLKIFALYRQEFVRFFYSRHWFLGLYSTQFVFEQCFDSMFSMQLIYSISVTEHLFVIIDIGRSLSSFFPTVCNLLWQAKFEDWVWVWKGCIQVVWFFICIQVYAIYRHIFVVIICVV